MEVTGGRGQIWLAMPIPLVHIALFPHIIFSWVNYLFVENPPSHLTYLMCVVD
jgi:hypothetical protein